MSPKVKVRSAMPSEAVVEVKCRVEEGVVFMGVAFRELPVGRSRWRLPQSRDRGLQGSTHCGYCVHGSHLLPMDHDRRNASTRRRGAQPASCRSPCRCRTADRYTLICDEPPFLIPHQAFRHIANGRSVRVTELIANEIGSGRRALSARNWIGGTGPLCYLASTASRCPPRPSATVTACSRRKRRLVVIALGVALMLAW
jgi:hypothetical protein